MKLIVLILAFVAVVTSFATMPANATTPERMTYSGDAFLRDRAFSRLQTEMSDFCRRQKLSFQPHAWSQGAQRPASACARSRSENFWGFETLASVFLIQISPCAPHSGVPGIPISPA